MSYRDLPHAAVNELMKWVRKQGKQVVSFHAWFHLKGWSSLPDWSAHLDVRSDEPLHVRIKRKGYRFVISPSPDDIPCPACDTRQRAAQDAVGETPEPAFVGHLV